MKNKKRALMILAHGALILTVLLLLLGSRGYKTAGPVLSDVRYIDTVSVSVNGGPPEEVTLPHSFGGLAPRTPVTVTAVIRPQPEDAVYIKSVYAPAGIYLNGELSYEFGQREHYPGFMKDPATEVHMVETHGQGEPMELRMEFLSPVSRSVLTVHPPMVGSSKELIAERQHYLGLSLGFSIIQIFLGGALILISVYIMLLDKKAVIFIWLGLFAMSAGLWTFGENNFTHIVFKNTATLYLLSFIGFFSFIVPLLRFVRTLIDFKNPAPVWYMELIMAFLAAAALLLQLTGTVSCSRSMYFFHAALPVILLSLCGLTIAEFVRYRSTSARRMMIPLLVLALSAMLELFNYRFTLTYAFSSVFQLGTLIFLLSMGIIGGLHIKDSHNLQERQKELAFEKGLVDIQIKEQQGRSQLLAQHEAMLSQQRHDLRHHLEAIKALAGDNTELMDYLNALTDRIPRARERFCVNGVVNAIVAHYDALCGEKGIRFTARLDVPVADGSVTDSDLCVIFGNLLENAVEACDRMDESDRFITICSRVLNGTMTITMDNSFSGEIATVGDRFLSSKRDDFGIGIASVRSIVERAHGHAEFRPDGKVFRCSVYLAL